MLSQWTLRLLAIGLVKDLITQNVMRSVSAATLCASDGSSYTLSVDVSNGIRTVTTTGCPDYNWTNQSTPNVADIKSDVYVMPSEPQICSNPTIYVGAYLDLEETTLNPSPVMAAIGVAFDGVAIYSNSDALGRDAYIYEGASFDQCNGHAAADGTYHYHAQVPDDCLIVAPQPGAHSSLYGFMADGVPIYGPLGDNGVAPTDLDECSGHTDETYGFYHYHVIANYQYPYTVNCLKGSVDSTKWQNFAKFGTTYTCTNPTTYDYSSLDSVWNDISLTSSTSQTQVQATAPSPTPTSTPQPQIEASAPTPIPTTIPQPVVQPIARKCRLAFRSHCFIYG